MLRALRVLRDEGRLEFRRGRNVTVTDAAPDRSALLAKAHDLVEHARLQGYTRHEVMQLIEELT